MAAMKPEDYFLNPPPGMDLQESRTTTNNVVAAVMFALSAVFVALRTFTRFHYQRVSLQLDDYLMFAGLTINAGNLACCILGGIFKLGKHIYIVEPWDMRQISIITFAYVLIYAWSVCVIKFSILALYRRIFGMTWLGWWCVFLTSGYLITNHIVIPMYAKPLNFYWDQWMGGEGVIVIDEANFYLGIGIINLFGDICILAVPIQSVLKLQMTKTQKIAVCSMFLLGSFVCFSSLYRIVTIVRLTQSTDISWAKSDVFIWSSIEPSVGIISGCLPTLRPILVRILEVLFNKHPSSAGHNHKSRTTPSSAYATFKTISKRRTRKIPNVDADILADDVDLDVEMDGSDGSDKDSEAGTRGSRNIFLKRSQQGAWRPDEDEMSLTTTVIQVKERREGEGRMEDIPEASAHQAADGSPGMAGVHVLREFAWGEDCAR